MSLERFFTREEMDHALFLVAKEYKRIAGRKAKAEIVLVGGAAILANHSFRQATMDIDAYTIADRDLKMAITHVADAEGYPGDWLNDGFIETESFSSKLVNFSIPYKTFANCLEVRVLPPVYLLATKLAAWRPYKHDRSDALSIINELKDHDSALTFEQIVSAFEDLYGDVSRMKVDGSTLRGMIDSCNEDLIADYDEREKRIAELVRSSLAEEKEKGKTANIADIISQIEKREK